MSETLILSALWGLSAAGLAWYCLSIGAQITYVTLADGRRQERRLPLLFRLLLPLAPNLTPLLGHRLLQRVKARHEKRLTAAGFRGLLSPEEFLALRVLLPVVPGLLIWTPFVWACTSAGAPAFLARSRGLLYAVGLLWLFGYPGLWLRSSLSLRHGLIRRALPFVLDLLTLSVEAGMDFMTALQRNVERSKVDPLNEEFITVIRQIQVGKTRRDALRDMAQRVNLADLRSVINALVQADELGVSIGSILRIQSDQIRQRRFEYAEKLANEAPVKMLFPLLFCIFPAVFLILLGPVIARLLQQGF